MEPSQDERQRQRHRKRRGNTEGALFFVFVFVCVFLICSRISYLLHALQNRLIETLNVCEEQILSLFTLLASTTTKFKLAN